MKSNCAAKKDVLIQRLSVTDFVSLHGYRQSVNELFPGVVLFLCLIHLLCFISFLPLLPHALYLSLFLRVSFNLQLSPLFHLPSVVSIPKDFLP